jgi:hypothetical protein
MDMKIVIIMCFKKAPINAGTLELEGFVTMICKRVSKKHW